jgi:hypothetical protein
VRYLLKAVNGDEFWYETDTDRIDVVVGNVHHSYVIQAWCANRRAFVRVFTKHIVSIQKQKED